MSSNLNTFIRKNEHLIHQSNSIIIGQLNGIDIDTIQKMNTNQIIITTDYSIHRSNSSVYFPEHISKISSLKIKNVILFFTKSKPENIQHLNIIKDNLDDDFNFYILGEKDGGINSAVKFFEKNNIHLRKIESARHCSLLYGSINKSNVNFDYEINSYNFKYHNSIIEIESSPGVFCSNKLDDGTAFLLENLPNISGDVLDICCGAGVIGISLKKEQPSLQLTLSDCNHWAILATEANLKRNQVIGNVLVSDMFSEITQAYDCIIANPPFHAGFDTSYGPTFKLLTEAKSHLKPDGQLLIVANKFLPYEQILNRNFSAVHILNENNRFKIISARL